MTLKGINMLEGLDRGATAKRMQAKNTVNNQMTDEQETITRQHAIEAEQAILGAILSNNDSYHEIGDLVTAEQFYEPLHGDLFEAIGARINRGSVADPVNIARGFAEDARLVEVGGASYLAHMAGMVISYRHLRDYAGEIVATWRRRKLHDIASDIIDLSNRSTTEVAEEDLQNEVEALMADWSDTGQARNTIMSLKDAADIAMDEMHKASKGGIVGIPSDLEDLDTLIGGFKGGELYVMAGRPGMGKSAVGASIALGAALSGHGVGYFALEMTKTQVTNRILADLAHRKGGRVPYEDIENGHLNGGQFSTLQDALREVDGLPLMVDDMLGRTVASIQSAARIMDRRLKKQGSRLSMIVVDHMSIIRPTGQYRGNKVAEMGQISFDLKRMARTMDIPVLALSQLNRMVEGRDDKRPRLSDLRESGAIEQDADIVFGVYRPVYYHLKERPKAHEPGYLDWEAEYESCKDVLDLMCLKRRQGREKDLRLWVDIGCNAIRCTAPTRQEQSTMTFGG